MVWFETAKFGSFQHLGRKRTKKIRSGMRTRDVSAGNLAFGLLQKTRPQRRQNHLVKSVFTNRFEQGLRAHWRRLPAQRLSLYQTEANVKSTPRHPRATPRLPNPTRFSRHAGAVLDVAGSLPPDIARRTNSRGKTPGTARKIPAPVSDSASAKRRAATCAGPRLGPRAP